MTIIQHCEICGKPIALYTLLEDMKDGEDIYGRYKWFKAVHNFNEHPNILQRIFYLVIRGFYE